MTDTMTLYARYIGRGCFLRLSDDHLAFVNKTNRPDWLKEGAVYLLRETVAGTGVLFTVEGE